MEERISEFRTDDLALATVLNMHQIYHDRLERDGSEGAEWVFDDTDRLHKLVNAYERNRVRVDPRRFMREVRAVRGELYAFLQAAA